MAECFSFVDLFAGIGGFHIALEHLGGQCVFASEVDKHAIDTYERNFHINPAYNICDVSGKMIGGCDVLCAGFPCQPFSKAGDRRGFLDKTKGTLFFEVQRLIGEIKPKYIILENVRNLLTHDNGNTISVIQNILDLLGYNCETVVLSPHMLGVPQFRERVFILGIKKELYSGKITINIDKSKVTNNIYVSGLLEDEVDNIYKISSHEEKVLSCWDEFYDGISEKIIGFPIWSSEFCLNYDTNSLPNWKEKIVKKNRDLYKKNQVFIDEWLKKYNYLEDFTPTERKFEWQAGDAISSLWEGIIQCRPSGIRVKKPDFFPALVAMVQIPIIGKYRRRLTPREVARLQSFPDDFIMNENIHQAYKQFGNAVNVKCVEYLASQLFCCSNLL